MTSAVAEQMARALIMHKADRADELSCLRALHAEGFLFREIWPHLDDAIEVAKEMEQRA